MLKDGEYLAWFRTARGEGTGVVHLAKGRISGGDTVLSYGGSYEVDGDRFTAKLTTRRHAAGQLSVFGIDEVEVKLTGTSKGTIATCSGMVNEVPGLAFEATLIFSQDTPPRTEPRRTTTVFVAERFPRLAPRPRGRLTFGLTWLAQSPLAAAPWTGRWIDPTAGSDLPRSRVSLSAAGLALDLPRCVLRLRTSHASPDWL